jgi:hypothetical protein
VLKMNAGKRGLLVNAENLCRKKQQAIARFIGQSNRGWRLHPLVGATCEKQAKKRGKG